VKTHFDPSNEFTNYVFLKRLTHTTLMICSMCVPGCQMWSDQWSSYHCLERHGFVHGTVNHTLNFRDPVTGVHTNRIEGSWGAVKSFLRGTSAKSGKWSESYVHEWCFRRNIGTDFQTCWYTIVR